MRTDGRNPNEIRPLHLTPEVIRHAEGSVEISMGHTRLICTASVDDRLPKWLAGSGQGWVSAEYGMLPRSTHSRISREKALTGGRSQEISRLIGRALRAGVNLKALGERQINVDCDVIQADGGTRTAAVTGGFVALALALKFLQDQGELKELPLTQYIAAISVGLHRGEALLDLNYDEDFACGTDMNFVLAPGNRFVEVQGTAESGTYSRQELNAMLDLAVSGCDHLFVQQAKIIGSFFPLQSES